MKFRLNKIIVKYILLIVLLLIIFLSLILYIFFYNQKYLIILQNGWEARPWWGFFGSIAVVEFKWFDPNFKIEDAFKYQILAKEKKVYIPAPKYLEKHLMMNILYFLNSNIYGIPEKDARNIKYLYENITNTKINWVILVNSLWFEKISNNLRYIIWEWQFLNVLNLNKPLNSKFDTRKVEYLKRSRDFIKDNFFSLIYITLKNYKFLTENNYLQVYHTHHNNILKTIWLLHNYDVKMFYALDFYFDFRKVSRFLDKRIIVNNKIYKNRNYIYLWKNFVGEIIIQYSQNKKLLKEYRKYIEYLEQKYNVKLNYQQRDIIWLNWGIDYNLGIFYLPNNNFIYPNFCKKFNNILTCMVNSFKNIKIYIK